MDCDSRVPAHTSHLLKRTQSKTTLLCFRLSSSAPYLEPKEIIYIFPKCRQKPDKISYMKPTNHHPLTRACHCKRSIFSTPTVQEKKRGEIRTRCRRPVASK